MDRIVEFGKNGITYMWNGKEHHAFGKNLIFDYGNGRFSHQEWDWDDPLTEVEIGDKLPKPLPCHYPGMTSKCLKHLLLECCPDTVVIISTGCGYEEQKDYGGQIILNKKDRQGMLAMKLKLRELRELYPHLLILRVNTYQAIGLFNHCLEKGEPDVRMIFHGSC